MIKKFLCSFFTILFFSCGAAFAGLSVDPSITNVYNIPDSYSESYYLVKNTYDSDIHIEIKLSVGNVFSDNKGIDVNKVLLFKKKRYFIPAGETVKIPYKIYIGKDFKGSLAFKVGFQVEKNEGDMFSILMTMPVYIKVYGTEKIDFDIKSVELFTSNDSICYKLKIENKGNIHIRHSGSADIFYKNKKNLVKTVDIPETVPTYCESEREFKEILVSKSSLRSGKYIAVFKISDLEKEVEKEIKFKINKNGNLLVEQDKQK